jgi:stringent starvation protein B
VTTQSTKPYLLRAIYEWCVDQRLTPYLAVTVDASTTVPRSYVKDGQIVLNIGLEAANQLHMGNEFITFAARFGGVAESLSIPVGQVSAIYARENGHGMAFELETTSSVSAAPPQAVEPAEDASQSGPDGEKPSGARPHLVRIK